MWKGWLASNGTPSSIRMISTVYKIRVTIRSENACLVNELLFMFKYTLITSHANLKANFIVRKRTFLNHMVISLTIT